MTGDMHMPAEARQLKTVLLDLETGFWTQGPDFYLEHLDAACMTVFADMAGVSSAHDVAATVKEPGRWREVEIDFRGLHLVTPDMVMLSYEGSAKRADGSSYKALVSSGYVNRSGNWKLTFHSQIARDE